MPPPSPPPSLLRRIWFPTFLVALLLLSIPGLILFALHVFGGDEGMNAWLQENYQLSYYFPLHWSLALLLLLVPPLILLLYFLRLKRKPMQVPSTFLWRKSIEDLHVNSLFQWLRENILLLLQLLVVLLLILAVMGFRFHISTDMGKHYIIIIDNSASMSATDVGPSRLEWAKQEAIKVIDANGDENFGMVIAFSNKAATLQGYTSDRAKLRAAVESIEQTNHTTRIDDAMALADSLANQIRSTEDQASQPEGPVDPGMERQYVAPKGIPTEVYLFTDGGFPALSEASIGKLNSLLAGNTSALGNMRMRYHLAGATDDKNMNNVGILSFNVLRLNSNGQKGDPNDLRFQAFVQVRNYRPIASDVKLVLEVECDGFMVHSGQQTVSLPPKKAATDKEKKMKDEPGEAQAVFDLPQLDLRGNNILTARIKDANDAFEKDDAAWLVVGMVRKAKVLIVTPGNKVLEAFFQQDAIERVATVTTLTPAELTTPKYISAAQGGDFDLVIFDRCIPAKEEDMPMSNSMCIDRPPPPWERGSGVLKNPLLVVSRKDHSLLRHVTTLWDVGVSEAFKFHLKDNMTAAGKAEFFTEDSKNKRQLPTMTRLLEAAGDQPIVFTLTRGSYTDLVLTFPLIDDTGGLATNWPLQLSFPLFMRNVLYVMGNVIETDRERTVQPGEPMLLRPEADVKSLVITTPVGMSEKLQRGNRPEFIYSRTEDLGVYKVKRDDDVTRHFAVNLLDNNESNIEPRGAIKIAEDEVTAGEQRKQSRDIWKWLAVAALVLLVVEWLIYNRRIHV